jgi:hypothetical protein
LPPGGTQVASTAAVEPAMRLQQRGRHRQWVGQWVVEVGQRGAGELGAGIEDTLCRGFDRGALGVGGFGPGEVVVGIAAEQR